LAAVGRLEKALSLTQQTPEKRFIEQRLAELK
jgi:hypothetical protein